MQSEFKLHPYLLTRHTAERSLVCMLFAFLLASFILLFDLPLLFLGTQLLLINLALLSELAAVLHLLETVYFLL